MQTATIQITLEVLALIREVDEFNGAWRALETLAPERLKARRRVATLESIGSSTCIEDRKRTDLKVERLLANLEIQRCTSRREQTCFIDARKLSTLDCPPRSLRRSSKNIGGFRGRKIRASMHPKGFSRFIATETDEHLDAKYRITKKERASIESQVREMTQRLRR